MFASLQFHEFINLDPNSDDALAFKKLAIEQAASLDKVQKQLYIYDEESDQILKNEVSRVFLPNGIKISVTSGLGYSPSIISLLKHWWA